MSRHRQHKTTNAPWAGLIALCLSLFVMGYVSSASKVEARSKSSVRCLCQPAKGKAKITRYKKARVKSVKAKTIALAGSQATPNTVATNALAVTTGAVVATTSATIPPPPPPPPPTVMATKSQKKRGKAQQREMVVPDLSLVSTSLGQISGVQSADKSLVYKGITYAQGPVGELRFKPPVPIAPWAGIKQAKLHGPACAQRDYGWNQAIAIGSSEDCLTLDVRTPRLDKSAKLPVMVYIHGGANRAGSSQGMVDSALSGQGIVLVAIQYRLGALGFMSHPVLSAQDPNKASGHYALLDQIEALRWVKAHIADFGGDPDNVTLFGNSAGAHNTAMLMLTPLTKGLFHKAILQSGTAQYGMKPKSLEDNEAIGIALAKAIVPRTVTGPDLGPDIDPASPDAIAYLRNAPVETILAQADSLKLDIENPELHWVQPIVDGYVMQNTPGSILLGKQQQNRPLLIGYTASEKDLYAGKASVYTTVTTAFGDKASRALRFYRLDINQSPPSDPILGDVSRQVATDIIYRCPALHTAKQQTAVGAAVFVYQLEVFKPDLKKELLLATHGSEMPFVFDKRPNDLDVNQWPGLMDYWVAFAKSSAPGKIISKSSESVDWPSFGDGGNVLRLAADGPHIEASPRKPICKLLPNP